MEIADLPERRYCVRRHHGPVDTVDETRRDMYQHMISHELVGGASALRFVDEPDPLREVDVLIGAACGFDGDDSVRVEVLPAGPHAVRDWEGPVEAIARARREFLDSVRQRHEPAGPLLQVHLMDPIDGVTEQRFEVPLATASGSPEGAPPDATLRPKV